MTVVITVIVLFLIFPYFLYSSDLLCRFSLSYEVVCPPPSLCTDNGVMIAWNGVEKWRRGTGILRGADDIARVEVEPKWVCWYWCHFPWPYFLFKICWWGFNSKKNLVPRSYCSSKEMPDGEEYFDCWLVYEKRMLCRSLQLVINHFLYEKKS